jgi:hypothetical protein
VKNGKFEILQQRLKNKFYMESNGTASKSKEGKYPDGKNG